MKRVHLLFGLLLVASSAVVSADDIDMFKRLQNPNPDVRLASAQDSNSADISDSYPTQYVDPEALTEVPLVEQEAVPAEAVPAEAAAEGQIGGVDEYSSLIGPIADDGRVACGCGEGPIQQNAWDVTTCCPNTCRRRRPGCHRGCGGSSSGCEVVTAPVCADPCGAHRCPLSRRLHCLHARPICEVAAPVCVDPVCIAPVCVDPCAGGHGCHPAVRLHGGCHRVCTGGHGGHLLRHIRCCR